MQIQEFNHLVLAEVIRIITEENADRRCITNIEYILNKKLFGRSEPYQEIIPKYMGDVLQRFERELDALIQKRHYPHQARETTLTAFRTITSQIADISTNHEKPGILERVQQFRDTLQIAESDFLCESEHTRNNTVCYETDSNEEGTLIATVPGTAMRQPITPTKLSNVSHTEIDVVNQDSFEAADHLIKQGHQHVLVLNLANRFWAGGGVIHGATAQEEDLMRRSNYYFSLAQPNLTSEMTVGPYQKRHKYHQPIPEFGSIYSSSVIVFKDRTFKRLSPFEVSCLALAGYDLGKPEKFDDNERLHLLDSRGEIDLHKFQENTKRKIRHLFDVALENGHRNLVLGALSCGAFKLRNDTTGMTAQAVASAYREVLEESKYRDKFAKITFAILDSKPSLHTNFTVFSHILLGLNQPKAITLLSQYPLTSAATVAATEGSAVSSQCEAAIIAEPERKSEPCLN